MRLDKYLVSTGEFSRKEAAKVIRAGRVSVDGAPERKPERHIDTLAHVSVDGKELEYKEFRYIMLNKPAGYVSSTDDPGAPTVLELLPEKYAKMGFFPCGRLDRDTVGLMIMTNDGKSAHYALSPAHHVEKTYFYRCEKPLGEEDAQKLREGVKIGGGYLTKPCKLEASGQCEGKITLTEGKYHQIKEMFYSVGNAIVFLERVSFGGINLDPTLERGQYRELTSEEERLFCNDQSGDI